MKLLLSVVTLLTVSSLVIANCTTDKVVFLARHGKRYPPAKAFPILLGLNASQYANPFYDLNHLTAEGKQQFATSGTAARTKYSGFINDFKPLTQYRARSTHTARTSVSGQIFSENLYSSADYVPVYSDNSLEEDKILGSSEVCLAYQVTVPTLTFDFVLDNPTGLAAWGDFQNVLNKVTWTNPQNQAQVLPLRLFFQFVFGVDASNINNLPRLLPVLAIAQADVSAGLPVLGQPGKVTQSEADSMLFLVTQYQYGLFNDGDLTKVLANPVLSEVFNFLQGVVSDNEEDAAIGTDVRAFFGHGDLQYLLQLFGLNANRESWEEGNMMSLELQDCSGVKKVVSEYDGALFDLPGCSVSPCDLTDAVSGVSDVLNLDFDDECNPTPRCSVDYDVTSEWSSGWTATVTVTPTEDSFGWNLGFDFVDSEQVITSTWNGVYSHDGSHVTVTNPLNYNHVVTAGQDVSFGLQGTHNNNNPTPVNFKFNGRRCL